MPRDEWEPIALNYTSGTTGNPKGVVYHHRGAFLNAIGNAITFGLDRHSVYLWTLPMFHCNGWTYPWAVTAVAGTHVCLRRVDPGADLRGDRRASGHPSLRRADRPEPARARAGGGQAPLRPCRRGRDRRCGPALGGDRGDGADGVSGHPPLRPDRKLWSLDGLRLAGAVGRAADAGARRRAWRARGWAI